ncbi:hypothetical protein [Paenibacillus koleovorans]|uniref:hypothetical protein n=1 Tax=Paenibacillus koleovorans TaxID=121608 RepID=UPI000FD8F42C|nr:hypothetical protein [Paenibacillus koleovorans]
MNKVITGRDIGDTWVKAMQYLQTVQFEAYNLIAEIDQPIINDQELHQKLNAILRELGDQPVETVANTIFPIGLIDSMKNRQSFYSRFMALYPTLRKIPESSRGTYFGRLVAWNFESSPEYPFNQVEHTINKLIQAKQKKNRIRVRYEMSIYDPQLDCNMTMGFPCMSFISVKIRGEFIDLTAIYRNQHFIQKAYGNYLGLSNLLRFIAKESGFQFGKLTCIATHAGLGRIDKSNLNRLLLSDEQLTLDL